MATMDVKLICCEGNIAAGKSTLAKQLADRLGYVLFLEPTVENPFLEKYYGDPKAYALPMQLWLLKQRYITYVNALKYLHEEQQRQPGATRARGVILDRSIFSDVVFAEKNFRDGNFSREGYDYYLALRAQLLQPLPLPHAVLYLDVSPQQCYDRIHGLRQRDCEGGIPLAYLQGLHDCYRQLLTQMGEWNLPVLVQEWNGFGEADAVAAAIASLPAYAAPRGWEPANAGALRAFIFDAARVDAQMIMGPEVVAVPAAAIAADVAVADPSLITQAESLVMPTTLRAAADAASPRNNAQRAKENGGRGKDVVSPTSVADAGSIFDAVAMEVEAAAGQAAAH